MTARPTVLIGVHDTSASCLPLASGLVIHLGALLHTAGAEFYTPQTLMMPRQLEDWGSPDFPIVPTLLHGPLPDPPVVGGLVGLAVRRRRKRWTVRAIARLDATGPSHLGTHEGDAELVLESLGEYFTDLALAFDLEPPAGLDLVRDIPHLLRTPTPRAALAKIASDGLAELARAQLRSRPTVH